MGPVGDTGPTGKMAIVQVDGTWRALFCTEAPDVRFEDVIHVKAKGGEIEVPIDPMFVKVCEPGSLMVVMIQSEDFEWITAKVQDDRIIFIRPLNPDEVVHLKVSGIRASLAGMRFAKKTAEEAAALARK